MIFEDEGAKSFNSRGIGLIIETNTRRKFLLWIRKTVPTESKVMRDLLIQQDFGGWSWPCPRIHDRLRSWILLMESPYREQASMNLWIPGAPGGLEGRVNLQ